MEYISATLRLGFREICVSISLAQIDSIFYAAGFRPSTVDSNLPISGQRRTRVEEYYAAIDWFNISNARKFLRVISIALSQTYLLDDIKGQLVELCRQEGLIVDGTSVRFGDALGVDWFLSADSGFDRSLFATYGQVLNCL